MFQGLKYKIYHCAGTIFLDLDMAHTEINVPEDQALHFQLFTEYDEEDVELDEEIDNLVAKSENIIEDPVDVNNGFTMHTIKQKTTYDLNDVFIEKMTGEITENPNSGSIFFPSLNPILRDNSTPARILPHWSEPPICSLQSNSLFK